MCRVFGFLFGIVFAWSSASGLAVEPRWLVETPTAGTLPHGVMSADLLASEGVGLLGGISYGFWGRVVVNMSFGGSALIGDGSVNWNPDPGVSGRIRILNETSSRPAFAIGFRSQGFGPYDDQLERYASKSLGIYGVFSRNYANPIGQGGVHFGLNRSLEDDDGDDSLTGFLGTDLEIAERFSLLVEYQFGFNDNGGQALGRGNLSVGARLWVVEKVTLGGRLKNVLEDGGGRVWEVRVEVVRGR